jgi:hypothetical protein
VRQVLLARPDQLHRPAAGLECDTHRLADEVDVEAAAEAAADVGDVDRDRVFGDAGDLGRERAREPRRLSRRPDLDLALGDPRRAVDRLHRRVREVRRAIDPLDVAGAGGIDDGEVDAAAVEGEAGIGRGGGARLRFERRHDRLALERARGPLLPLDPDRRRATLRVPPRPADDRERGGRSGIRAEADDALDARQRQRRCDVDRAGAAAEHRAMADRRIQQTGRTNVAAEDRRAVALGDDIDPRRRSADRSSLRAASPHLAAGRRAARASSP